MKKVHFDVNNDFYGNEMLERAVHALLETAAVAVAWATGRRSRPADPDLRRFEFAGMLVQPAGVDQDLRCPIEMLAHQPRGEIYIPREHSVLDVEMLLLNVAFSVPKGHGEPPIALGLLIELPANSQ